MSVLAPLHHHMLSPWVDILTLVMFKGSVSRMSYKMQKILFYLVSLSSCGKVYGQSTEQNDMVEKQSFAFKPKATNIQSHPLVTMSPHECLLGGLDTALCSQCLVRIWPRGYRTGDTANVCTQSQYSEKCLSWPHHCNLSLGLHLAKISWCAKLPSVVQWQYTSATSSGLRFKYI